MTLAGIPLCIAEHPHVLAGHHDTELDTSEKKTCSNAVSELSKMHTHFSVDLAFQAPNTSSYSGSFLECSNIDHELTSLTTLSKDFVIFNNKTRYAFYMQSPPQLSKVLLLI